MQPLPAFDDNDAREPFLSTDAARFLAELLVENVPPLARGDLRIVSIARRPGVLSKVGVRSTHPAPLVLGDISRVRDLLDRERVEIVACDRDPRRYIQHALGLGEPPPVVLFPAIQHARVFLGEIDLRGIAGWRNLNVILASNLTGWRIRLLPIVRTAAWQRLLAAQRSGAAVRATVTGPRQVEVYGLYARTRQLNETVDGELDVRVLRMDPDEGRIVVTDRLRPKGQLRLPLAV